MGYPKDWVTIDNNSQKIFPAQSTNFLLTINVPSGTTEGNYALVLYFEAKDTNGQIHNFNYNSQWIMVDNSKPTTPTFLTTPKSWSLTVYSWDSYDSKSSEYTAVNSSSGRSGIKNYTVTLKYADNTVHSSKTFEATGSTLSYDFNQLKSVTQYKVSVSANDLAGNSNSSETTVLTAPAAPTLSTTDVGFCHIALNYNSQGASSYNIYNATGTSPILLANTNSSSYTVDNLEDGTTYKFFVKAIGFTGSISGPSSTLSVSTLTVPIPVIDGPDVICSSSANFYARNLPEGCSLSWNHSSNLTLQAASGVYANFKIAGSGEAWISADFVFCGDRKKESPKKELWFGKPNLGMIIGPLSVPIGTWSHFYIEEYTEIQKQHVTLYDWTLTPNMRFELPHLYRTDAYVSGLTIGRGTVAFISQNSCGTTSVSLPVRVVQQVYYTYSPNPVTANLTIDQLSASEANTRSVLTPVSVSEASIGSEKRNSDGSEPYTIEIWHEKNGKVKTVNGKSKKEEIDLSGLKKGNYFLHIITPTAVYKEHLVVE